MKRIIKAISASDAVSVALSEGDFLLTGDTNLVWLSNEAGTLVWSLRLDHENTERPLVRSAVR